MNRTYKMEMGSDELLIRIPLTAAQIDFIKYINTNNLSPDDLSKDQRTMFYQLKLNRIAYPLNNRVLLTDIGRFIANARQKIL